MKRTRGIDTIYQDLPLDDRETYRMLAKGMTGGVFQLEGQGMTNDVIVPMLADVDALPDDGRASYRCCGTVPARADGLYPKLH